MMNNDNNNNFNQIGMNMPIVVNKMDIINHLMKLNVMMQNQIEQNNILIQKLMNEPTLNQNFNNFIQNNNPGFPLNNFHQNINQEFSLNNQEEDYFPNQKKERINITCITPKGNKNNLLVPVNTTINQLLLAFMKKMKLEEDLIDKKIYFLFNAQRLKKDDKRTLSELGMKSNCRIVVIDT